MEEKKIFYVMMTVIIIFMALHYMSNNDNNNNNNNNYQIEKYSTESEINNSVTGSTCPICPVCPVCPDVKLQKCSEQNECDQKNKETNNFIEQPIQLIQQVPLIPQIQPIPNPLREYDYRTLNDPLVPPLKRDDYSGFLPTAYTRGVPEGYKKMGLLIDVNADNNDKYKFMILVGRLKYPRGTVYDYFVTENKHDSALKFDLKDIHRELYTDDEIIIPELGKTYKLKADRNLGFDYSPFLY